MCNKNIKSENEIQLEAARAGLNKINQARAGSSASGAHGGTERDQHRRERQKWKQDVRKGEF